LAIFQIFYTLLEKHSHNSDLFTKISFAFLPFIFESIRKRLFDEYESINGYFLESTFDYLVQYNLVRYFTIGLQIYSNEQHAVKAGLLN